MATVKPPRRPRVWLLIVPVVAAVVAALIPIWRHAVGHGDVTSTRGIAEFQVSELSRTLDGAPITALTFAPDSTIVVGTASGKVEFRNKDALPSVAGVMQVFNEPIIAVAVSRDGSDFAAATGRVVYVAKRSAPMKGIEIRPFDGSDLGDLSERNPAYAEFLRGHLTTVESIALDARGDLLAVGSFGVHLYDTRTGNGVAHLDQPVGSGRYQYKNLGFSADGTTLLASDYTQTDLWETSNWSLRQRSVRLPLERIGTMANPRYK